MPYRLAVEDIEPDHWIVWMLDLPACFSSGRTEKEAVSAAPNRIADYYRWCWGQDPSLPVPDGPFDTEIVESFRSFPSPEDPDCLVNAFFWDDRRPLTIWDVDAILRLFDWTRQDFKQLLDLITPDQLETSISNEKFQSIIGIVAHIANAENWYFSQIHVGLEQSDLPEGVFERLEATRENTRSQLAGLIGLEKVMENCGERWSPRKVIRRALWHERDHTQHIAKILSALP